MAGSRSVVQVSKALVKRDISSIALKIARQFRRTCLSSATDGPLTLRVSLLTRGVGGYSP
jgi:hypothetical protein